MDRRRFLQLAGSLAATLSLPRFVESKPVQRPAGPLPAVPARHALWYGTPAAEANLLREGLPVGNGRLGALVGGDPASTCLYLTDASMWLGKRDVVLGADGQFDYSTENFGSLVLSNKSADWNSGIPMAVQRIGGVSAWAGAATKQPATPPGSAAPVYVCQSPRRSRW